MNYKDFADQKIKEIKDKIGGEKALVALSGGVDSSVVSAMAHKALGKNLMAYFIDDYFRKKDEYEFVREIFKPLGIEVRLCNIQNEMLNAFE